MIERKDLSQIGEDFDEMWESTVDPLLARQPVPAPGIVSPTEPKPEAKPVTSTAGSIKKLTGDVLGDVRDEEPITLRSGEPALSLKPQKLPPRPEPKEDKSTTIKESDGTTIDYEAADNEENAIIVEEIATFNFEKFTLKPRSAASGEMLRKGPLLAGLCAEESLDCNFDGKFFIITKKPGANFNDRVMEDKSREFIRLLVGFFCKETQVE